MDQQLSLSFIEKAISNTKNNKIAWSSLKGQKQLVNKHPADISDALQGTTISGLIPRNIIHYDKSYYARFNEGYIFLLLISNDISAMRDSSQDPFDAPLRFFSLRIQSNLSSYSKEIANSKDSSEISIQLNRLYNLAEDDASNLNSFINDFLNS